jgi:hypothetical protein
MTEKRPRRRRTATPEDVHDILAAEAFAVPEADPSIHPRPVVLPEDPTGILEAHDILAAEEFAMPSVRPHVDPPPSRGLLSGRSGLIVAGLLLLVIRRRRRRRRQGQGE